jgi:chromosome segregation ATPase
MKKKDVTEDDRRQIMDSLEQLKKTVDAFSSEFSRLDLLVATAENKIIALNSKQALLEADVKNLEEKRNNLDIQVKEERKSEILAIEAKLNEARKAKEEADDVKSKMDLRAAEVARKDMELKALKEEYEAQLSDLNKQKEIVESKKKDIEAFFSKIR